MPVPHVLVRETATLQILPESDDEEETVHLRPLLPSPVKEVSNRVLHHDDSLLATQSPLYAEARDILASERRTAPIGTVLALSGLFVWLVFTDTMKDLVSCGSIAFWAFMLSIVPLVVIMMAVIRRQLIHKDVVKAAVRGFYLLKSMSVSRCEYLLI
jgi:hypothetical protein